MSSTSGRVRRSLAAALTLLLAVPVGAQDAPVAAQPESRVRTTGPAPSGSFWDRLTAPCNDDCAFAVYAGNYVESSMGDVLVTEPALPWNWEYNREDKIAAFAASRRVVSGFWNHWDVETEGGFAKRFGEQDEWEVWGAFFFRYNGFPWDEHLVTTLAFSTGLNWASAISDVEVDRAKDDEGSQLMHFFSPEVTFALPSNPGTQLLFRFHHRSGVFGLVSDAWGGAQYGTVGLRIWF